MDEVKNWPGLSLKLQGIRFGTPAMLLCLVSLSWPMFLIASYMLRGGDLNDVLKEYRQITSKSM